MSILSGDAIWKSVKNGRIVIDPFDPKYLNPASIDLTLGDKVGVYVPKDRVLDSKIENPYDVRTGMRDMTLTPGNLYLMHTAERVGSQSLVPELDGKSSIGRLGVCVHLTAGLGDPGFFGQYTLEVTVVRPVVLYAGMRIAQMRFHTMEFYDPQAKTRQYAGNYVGPTAEGPVPSKSWKQFA